MTIDELIKQLTDLREYVENVEVEVRNEVGDFDIADNVNLVSIRKNKYYIHIDV